ncbi:hypothetical protein EHZ19_02175 [Paraburkholderia bannensis]|uniref:Uncharacterized protein n=1 Tax=Paraburkholderia tropica TaxID=92647 RepID=A0AAQ1GD83_9BURK|nr:MULTISPECIES: hypothetical protein [Paraburkholderia]RQM50964.1 hypothetical protein EHZ19_02175 [Paraburkholderia bannensis]RQN40306.1 hypothetical protein EHZ25_02690 [Paraburkholderia tropica]SEJ33313.1 hypothetical protein SAMN05216550_10444 [Paraburkholderia tropica]
MLKLRFYPNSRKVWIGELLGAETRLLAATHPATIAAAVFAMDEHKLCVETAKGRCKMAFPFEDAEGGLLAALMQDAQMYDWMRLFCTFSRFDFANPLPYDTKADVHFRVAVFHLPAELVKVHPSEPEPENFKLQLRKRNQFIYYPWC